MKMARLKFLRRNTTKYLRLGKKRKKLQKWRAPKGRDNKMRLKTAGRPRTVEIGYRNNKQDRGKLKGKTPVIVHNIQELENIKQNEIAVLAKVGRKNKIKIVEKAKQKNIHLANLNIEKFLQSQEKKETNENKENKHKENKEIKK